MTNLAAATPLWPAEWTAYGTVAVAVAAVGIAIWSDWRTGRRLDREREAHDQEIAEEREAADDRLKAQMEHSDRQLIEEREAAETRLQQERQLAQDREQLNEAYAVQVVPGEKRAVGQEPGNTELKRLAVFIVNRGQYTITRIEVQFSHNGRGLVSHHRQERIPGFSGLPDQLRAGWGTVEREVAMLSVLTPWDTGLRVESDDIHVQHLASPYPVVRWTDRWGTRWEHRKGEVRQVKDNEQWTP